MSNYICIHIHFSLYRLYMNVYIYIVKRREIERKTYLDEKIY